MTGEPVEQCAGEPFGLDAFMTPLSLIGWYVGPWLGARWPALALA
jgi:hypothetical protein